MIKIAKKILWILVAIVILAGIDQCILRLPTQVTGLQQTQEFYLDFRSRLIQLTVGGAAKPPETIDAVIERTALAEPEPTKNLQRFLYVDETGTLQFADSLQLVPKKYRQSAQPLAE